jgi:hypothetical protein
VSEKEGSGAMNQNGWGKYSTSQADGLYVSLRNTPDIL